jgi:hypothetical protein
VTVQITHSYADGTVLSGLSKPETRRGTPVRQILDDNAWTWRPQPGWFQRSSRNQLPRRHRIDNTAARLRDLGYEVTVTIDTTVRDMAQVEQERAERMDDRAAALDAKADRRARAGRARVESADAFFGALPIGQPIIGEADRRRRERHHETERRGRALLNQAATAADRAQTARAHRDRRYHPRTVRLQTQLAEAARGLASESEAARSYWQPIHDKVTNELTYWRTVHAEHLAEGKIRVFTRADITRGDWVLGGWPGGWHRVVRVNPKTVTIETDRKAVSDGWFTNTVPYHEITNVRSANQPPPDASSAPAGDHQP